MGSSEQRRLVPTTPFQHITRLLCQPATSQKVGYLVSTPTCGTRACDDAKGPVALSGARLVGRRRIVRIRTSRRYPYTRSSRGCRGDDHHVSRYWGIHLRRSAGKAGSSGGCLFKDRFGKGTLRKGKSLLQLLVIGADSQDRSRCRLCRPVHTLSDVRVSYVQHLLVIVGRHHECITIIHPICACRHTIFEPH
jgi:hypothetical protein